MLMKRKTNRLKTSSRSQPRLQRVSPGDRKRELIVIAYRAIAEKGLEGFRIRQVAAEADIDNGTLHYHFPSKEALIHGVVDYLVEDLQNNRAGQEQANQNALEELRKEFEDIRLRVRDTPEQLTVLSELAIRSWRDPEIARIFKKVDDGWRSHLVALIRSWRPTGHIPQGLEPTALCEGDYGGPERCQLSIEATGSPARPALVTTCCPNGALAKR
jgi:AcrR family transcriptional regulator